MASIFGIWSQKRKWKKNGQTKWQIKTECVRNGKWKNKQEAIEEIKKNEFGSGIEKDNETKVRIQKPAAAKKHQNNHAKKEQGFEHHADKKKQKFDVHVASILWKKKKNDSSGGAIDYIKIKHEETMQRIGN